MDKLFTIAEMAKQLDIPESSARYYRDRFPEYFPSRGKGRNKRYEPEALEALRLIAEQLRNGRTAGQVAEALSLEFPAHYDHETKLTATAAAGPQQGLELYRQDIETRQDLAEAIKALVEQNQALIEELRRPWWKRLFGIK